MLRAAGSFTKYVTVSYGRPSPSPETSAKGFRQARRTLRLARETMVKSLI
jgi:hypothetical protein